MDRYVTRPQSSGLKFPADPFATMDPLLVTEEDGNPPPPVIQVSGLISSYAPAFLTPNILDAKLDAKLQLQQITQSILAEVSKISVKLRGEITQIGERTDKLEHKFDEMVNYVQAIEE